MKEFDHHTNNNSIIYNNILVDIAKEIRHFRIRYQKKPDYIIISNSDLEAMLQEMHYIGILPNRNKEGDFSFNEIPVIQSLNFDTGQFDIVGS